MPNIVSEEIANPEDESPDAKSPEESELELPPQLNEQALNRYRGIRDLRITDMLEPCGGGTLSHRRLK